MRLGTTDGTFVLVEWTADTDMVGPQTSALVDALHAPGASDYAALFERYGSELPG
jgi:hypothetical protein